MKLKREIFYLAKAFFEYKRGVDYIHHRFFVSPRIFKKNSISQKKINRSDLSIHVLTSHHDLTMLFWALASFIKVSEILGQLIIHSDGSLTPRDKKIIGRVFPTAEVIEPADFINRFEPELKKWPDLHRLRTAYPDLFLLKKLVDPFFSSAKKWHLIVDSDLLWFGSPDEIYSALNSDWSLMMQGLAQGEGNIVVFKDGTKLAVELAHYNSGIVLYQRDNFDLEKLNDYAAKIDPRVSRNCHFIEQAGYAYCLRNLTPLPTRKYQIKGAKNDQTIVKHYTAPRRPMFFAEGVKELKNKILNQ